MNVVVDEEKVRKRLTKGRYVAETPREGERLTSPVYNIIHVIYDVRTNERVLHWYFCSKCSKIINVNLTRNGNSQLTRHKCYTKWLSENNDPRKSEESDNEDSDYEDSNDDETISHSDKENLNDDELNTNDGESRPNELQANDNNTEYDIQLDQANKNIETAKKYHEIIDIGFHMGVIDKNIMEKIIRLGT